LNTKALSATLTIAIVIGVWTVTLLYVGMDLIKAVLL
jgi:hypothetical protein